MFNHLHFHTSYSFLDGYNPIEKAVARVKELGMGACAITDHNHLGGIPVFQEECQKQGIKPILGMEGYYTLDMHEAAKPIEERKTDAIKCAIEAGVLPENYKKLKKSEIAEVIQPYMYDMHQYHILYIAKNQVGWKNLVKLQSESARLCTYNGRYLADMELIRAYSEGLIVTTACIGSYSSRCIQQGDYDAAEAYIREMQEIFGEDFYLEIQPLNIEEQMVTNLFYMAMGEKYDIKLIATNDVHYTFKPDWDDHDTLLCIGTGKFKTDADRMRYSHDFWIKSEEEMLASFQSQDCARGFMSESEMEEYRNCYEQALRNTQLVADKVDAEIRLGSDKPLFSNVKVPKGFTAEDWLTLKAYRGMYKYLVAHPECDAEEYTDRLAEELNVINTKGFAPYMLAVEEYVTWANEHGCPTGPGRGSAAGSLVLFCIGVTKNIDPIKNKLLFSRFLTKDRLDPPDWKQVA